MMVASTSRVAQASIRSFATTCRHCAEAAASKKPANARRKTNMEILAAEFDIANLRPGFDDVPSSRHLQMEKDREMLHYKRLVHFQLPELASKSSLYCKYQSTADNRTFALCLESKIPFNPPSLTRTPLRLKLNDVFGESAHPHVPKVTLTAKISALPLKTPEAVHKFKVLAGPRWDSHLEEFTLSSDRFASKEENAKWCSDTLDRLLSEAHVCILVIFYAIHLRRARLMLSSIQNTEDLMSDIPLDPRPTLARLHRRRNKLKLRPTTSRQSALLDPSNVAEFPKEWLPKREIAAPEPQKEEEEISLRPGQRRPKVYKDVELGQPS